jgi:hypothetical protein
MRVATALFLTVFFLSAASDYLYGQQSTSAKEAILNYGRSAVFRSTSGLPVIQEAQTVSASCVFFSLLAVDLPTLGWRQA